MQDRCLPLHTKKMPKNKHTHQCGSSTYQMGPTSRNILTLAGHTTTSVQLVELDRAQVPAMGRIMIRGVHWDKGSRLRQRPRRPKQSNVSNIAENMLRVQRVAVALPSSGYFTYIPDTLLGFRECIEQEQQLTFKFHVARQPKKQQNRPSQFPPNRTSYDCPRS